MVAKSESTLTFHGGAGAVTGANFLLEIAPSSATDRPIRLLVDCGLYQGGKVFENRNNESFPYDPATIDYLFVTHAHLDHVGRIPKLVHQGFRGVIYSTLPTKKIAALILEDSLGLMGKEARGSGQPLLYDLADVAAALARWQTLEYRSPLTLGNSEVTVTSRDAGHILGSAMYEVTRGDRRLLFTGDLGNSPSPLLHDTEVVKGVNYLVMESVYGDREHGGAATRRDQLEDVIENTMRADGVLLIPAFSIERTQELLYEIEHMTAEGRIPPVPVYLDSPLAIQVTEIYKNSQTYFNAQVADPDHRRDGLFNFPNLHQTLTTEESRAIVNIPGRKIIIAGSGMSNGGRIIHHEKHYLSSPTTTLLLIGYQAAGSLGRLLEEGAKEVTILGTWVLVRARILTFSGYSAHRDGPGLLDFVHQLSGSLEMVFATMGEPKASLFLVQRIRDYLGIRAIAPRAGESAKLEL
ncbi:MAG TPA: MBL fold metallo-hydrolase [Candidatus Paceibacterota bacterium]